MKHETTTTDRSTGTRQIDGVLQEHADLTKFQTLVLRVLDDGPRYGLAIKRCLEAYYGKEVNHGRLYPNLDTLVQRGLVEKSARDKRTNEYAITPAGEAFLEADAGWREAIPTEGQR